MNMQSRKITLATLTAIALAFSTPAWAAETTKLTADFINQASVANRFEVESSQLAMQKSQNSDIRAFAQQMVTDHSRSGEQLVATMANAELDQNAVKTVLDEKHQKKLEKL